MPECQRLLIGCDILKREVEYLFADKGWPCSRLFLTSDLHFDFDLLKQALSRAIEKNSNKEVLLLYGTCYPGIEELPSTRRVPCQNCVEMLLGRELFQSELENGAYFLLEQWAQDWDEVLVKSFGTRQVAREIFQGDRRYLLALRTPCSGDFSAQAEAAAASVGLPLRWMDVSLEHLQQQLTGLLADRTGPPDLDEECAFQKARADRLAAEKSYLQLVTVMMNRLSSLPGLENTIQNMLELVVDSIGGTSAALYYFMDDTILYADLAGAKLQLERIDDALVLEAMQTRQPAHDCHDFQDTLMQARVFTSATSWAVPLMTGTTLVGLFKIDNMHLESDQFLPNLAAFFRYAALILKNEIYNYLQLQQAYEQQKLLQAQLFQQEKLASIGQLAAGVAHEINNPMGFITSNLGTLHKYLDRLVSYTKVMNETVAECTTAEQRATLEETRRKLKIDHILTDAQQLVAESLEGADRVKYIVNDLKSFARADQNQMQPLQINSCITTALNLVRNEYKYCAELQLDLQEQLPELNGNSQQLVQVISNLVVNAAHAIEKQGVISVSSRQQDDLICVIISDTGHGIPEDVKNRIFEPFFTTKEVGKGTGLGLSISYNIIKKHGGEITVESEAGRGTTFTVRLPVVVQEEAGT